jgi:VWFA-related protein
VLLIAPLVLAQQHDPEQEPIESGIVERTRQRLVQLDVSFSPKKKAAGATVPELTPADFHLVVNARPVRIEHADRICNVTRQESLVEVRVEETDPAKSVPVPGPRATFIFYIEHTLLTMLGQNIALEMVERLVPELVADGNRGMIVSSGGKVIQSEFSEDPDDLLAMIRSIRKDTKQWSEYVYAQGEVRRYEDIFSQPSTGSQRIAARAYQLEEMRITTNRLRRLAAMIGGMAEIDPPKAVFYFADMARQRPGEHFIRLFTASQDEILGTYTQGGAALGHSFSFDDVLNEANAQGVRLYTVQAQGIQPPAPGRARRPNQAPSTRIREAENTLKGFAAETGGRMFFGGVEASTMGKIRRQIDEDFGCFYLLSFYPTDLPEDRTLRVLLQLDETERGRVAERDFHYRTRGQLVVQSRRKREQSLLLAAHAATETVDADPGRGVVIPLAFADGAYQALVQFVVRGSDLAAQLAGDCLWDLGMTHVFGPDVKGKVAGRVGVEDASAPVVLETLWTFQPGVSEIVSVGREHRLGQLATAQINLEWPDPDQARATVSPIALVQQYDGVFLRKNGEDEDVRYRGTIGVGPGLVHAGQPAYLIELVCRGKRAKQDLWIQRRLAGETAADFELLKWTYDGERCIQVRDFVREGQMDWGEFSYSVAVYDNERLEGNPIATGRRDFAALGDDSVDGADPNGSP